ncbi:hypothetical protein E2F47_23535 [Mycobacterium eburneum]|nr:hypothetical protein [Mycobacterium eburneum]TDH48492.1 hypothetical protein E2F47_23535 [Mycobacterium eburneum]
MAKGISIGRAARSKRVIRALERKANKCADYWRSIAPVFGDLPPKRAAPPEGEAGDYKAAVAVKRIDNGDGSVRFRVYDSDPKAHWIEYGTAHMPEYAPAAKTKAKFRGKR